MTIEQLIYEYLSDEIEDVPVFPEIPTSNLPETFIVFNVIDRGLVDYIEAVTVEFWSYAPTIYEASALDEVVRETMLNMVSLPEISSSKLGGGRHYNDTTLKKHRYRCYFNLYL